MDISFWKEIRYRNKIDWLKANIELSLQDEKLQ